MIHQTIFDNSAKENAMELDRYRALVCAIETGSLSAAAEALQYTPSGVSRMGAVLGLVIGELVSRYASKLFQKRG